VWENKSMITIREIQDRVILVDYYPGSHGFFLINTLHGLLYNNLKKNETFEKNFHSSKLVPTPFSQEDDTEITFLNFNIDEKKLLKFDNNIFWPSHWSLYWANKKIITKKPLPDLTSHINNIPIIELYVTNNFWLRHYINYWFNIGYSKVTHQELSNNDFFIKNFYSHCKQINSTWLFETYIGKNITLNPEEHTFSKSEILAILEHQIFVNHGHSYNLKNAPSHRTLNTLAMPNSILSIPMDNFYDFDLFKSTILNIKNFFKLNYTTNDIDLAIIWGNLISMQQPIRVYNSSVADNDLTLLEHAYRNFLNKCK